MRTRICILAVSALLAGCMSFSSIPRDSELMKSVLSEDVALVRTQLEDDHLVGQVISNKEDLLDNVIPYSSTVESEKKLEIATLLLNSRKQVFLDKQASLASAFARAVLSNLPKFVELLVASGADPQQKFEENSSALELVLERNRSDLDRQDVPDRSVVAGILYRASPSISDMVIENYQNKCHSLMAGQNPFEGYSCYSKLINAFPEHKSKDVLDEHFISVDIGAYGSVVPPNDSRVYAPKANVVWKADPGKHLVSYCAKDYYEGQMTTLKDFGVLGTPIETDKTIHGFQVTMTNDGEGGEYFVARDILYSRDGFQGASPRANVTISHNGMYTLHSISTSQEPTSVNKGMRIETSYPVWLTRFSSVSSTRVFGITQGVLKSIYYYPIFSLIRADVGGVSVNNVDSLKSRLDGFFKANPPGYCDSADSTVPGKTAVGVSQQYYGLPPTASPAVSDSSCSVSSRSSGGMGTVSFNGCSQEQQRDWYRDKNKDCHNGRGNCTSVLGSPFVFGP